MKIRLPTWLAPADRVQCLQGQLQGRAVLRQLCLDARRRVLSLKLGANVHDMLQDLNAAGGDVLSQLAANGKGFTLTLG